MNFIFGKEAVELLAEEGIDTLIETLEDGDYISFALYEFTPNTNPAELLYSFKGWDDYAVITQEEYGRLKDYA